MTENIDYLKDFRNSDYAALLSRQIRSRGLSDDINIMEICGGHTISIFKFGIKELLPENIHLLSGPGCPVCVTSTGFIDRAIEIGKRPDTIIATFGDMIRVPGSGSSLMQERAQGRRIKICLSAADAVKLAAENPDKKVVFLAIGFETTAPTIAASVKMAEAQKLNNFFILSALKTMPEALKALIGSQEFNVQGFICPGHVTAVTGISIYRPVTEQHNIPCVVTGFEPLDLLHSIDMIVQQLLSGKAQTEIQYTRSVKPEGNPVAIKIIEEVFEPWDAPWRGLGPIPGSGLKLRDRYAAFDAASHFQVDMPEEKAVPGCLCGPIMRGVKTPLDCRLFDTACRPTDPKGACMVSAEGTCATYFKYNRK